MNCSPAEPLLSFTAEQRFLVTGASSGIGAEITRLLCRLGATVIATGRDEEKLAATRESCTIPGRVFTVSRDLTVEQEKLPEWVTRLVSAHGPLQGLVCSAGIALPMPLRMLDPTVAHRLFAINYFAPLFLANGFLRMHNNNGAGSSLVFIASLAASIPQRTQSLYAGSKAALVESAKCISMEYSGKGIRVNCISPAEVVTPLLYGFSERLGEMNPEQAIAPRYPLGLGQPADIASLAAFLLSDCARWITGQNYILDGGFDSCAINW